MSIKTQENLKGDADQQRRQALAKETVDRILKDTPRQISTEKMVAFAQSERLSAVREFVAEVRKRAMTDDGNECRIGGISEAMTAVLKEMDV